MVVRPVDARMGRRFWPLVPFGAAVLISVLAALTLLEVYQLQVGRRHEAARADVVAQLGAIRARLEGTLTAPLLITRGLVANIIQRGGITDAEFSENAAILLTDYPMIRNITLARGTVISAVYPVTANRAVLGVDYRSRADQWVSVERAISSRRPVVAGPVQLIQGGTALIGRVPIFLPGMGRGDSKFYGLISVVIDIPSVFSGAGIGNGGLPITLAIRGRDGLGAAGSMIWGDPSVFAANAVEMDVSLPDGSWRMGGLPKDGWSGSDGELQLTRLLGGFLWFVVVLASFGTAFYASSLRRARERIAESEERYRALMETAPVAVCVHRDGKIIFANSATARLIGAEDAGRLEGLSVMDVVHPDCHELARIRIASVMSDGGQNPPTEQKFITLDGRIIDADVISSRVMLNGRPAVLSILRDVTLEHQAAAERDRLVGGLQRSNDDLQQFAYIASHDLQEPLRNVASYVQLLGKRYQGRLDSDADEFIAYAVDGAKRMQEMITDLLDYSRLQVEGEESVPTDSRKVVDRVLSDLSAHISDCDALVELGALPVVLCREHELGRIFLNLVGNALKYRRQDVPPRIQILARLSDRVWTFSVSDNGIGISPEYRDKVFSLFTRLHSRRSYGGTGIGLAICRKLIQHNGGQIWVEESSAGGCCFKFTLAAVD